MFHHWFYHVMRVRTGVGTGYLLWFDKWELELKVKDRTGFPLMVTTCVLDRLSLNPLRNSSLHQGSAGIHYLGAAVFGGRYLNTGCGDFLLTCLSNYCILVFVYHSLTNL